MLRSSINVVRTNPNDHVLLVTYENGYESVSRYGTKAECDTWAKGKPENGTYRVTNRSWFDACGNLQAWVTRTEG